MKIFFSILIVSIFSLNLFSQNLLGPETFDTDIIINGTSGPTNQWFGPNYYTPIDFVSTGGCPNGNASYQGSWNNYWMNFLRTPAVDCTGLDTVILTVDLSNSYYASHTNDKLYFNMWIDGGYEDAVINQTVYFDQLRDCETIEVTYDLTPYIDKTAVLFYLNASCGYNDSQNYYVKFDNISIQSNFLDTTTCIPFAGNDTMVCGLQLCLSSAFLSSQSSSCSWSLGNHPIGSSVNPVDPNDANTCVTVSDFGQYEFILTETNGACTNSDTISINFIEVPNAYAGPDQFVCGLETDLEAVALYSGYWQSTTGITFVDSAYTQTHIVSDHFGIDTLVWVEINQQCTSISSVVITFDPCASISDIETQRIYVSPNPSTGNISIYLEDNTYKILKIINHKGQETTTINIQKDNFDITLEKGIYILIFIKDNLISKKQVVIY